MLDQAIERTAVGVYQFDLSVLDSFKISQPSFHLSLEGFGISSVANRNIWFLNMEEQIEWHLIGTVSPENKRMNMDKDMASAGNTDTKQVKT